MEQYLGESIAKLGFGLMRLPMIGEKIDVEQTKQMVDLFMEKGFNYFDTAYGYNEGESERAAKAALVDRYPRDSFYLATKLPAWMAKSREEAQQMFYTSLERTGAGYFDFYLLHNLGRERAKKFDDYDIWNFVQERRKEGLIRHVGFSIHDNAEALDEILTKHPEVEFVQLQINYVDWESPSVQSRLCYETARAHGKPVIIMEPVKGGLLAGLPPTAAAPLLSACPGMSTASWGIRFAAGLPGVITVLSGMSSVSQMQDNLSYMQDFKPLTETEQTALRTAVAELEALPSVPCTGCNYCAKGCPQGIPISEALHSYNVYKVYGNLPAAQRSYGFIKMRGLNGAGACIGCGQCESVCPQGISIIDELKNAAELLEG